MNPIRSWAFGTVFNLKFQEGKSAPEKTIKPHLYVVNTTPDPSLVADLKILFASLKNDDWDVMYRAILEEAGLVIHEKVASIQSLATKMYNIASGPKATFDQVQTALIDFIQQPGQFITKNIESLLDLIKKWGRGLTTYWNGLSREERYLLIGKILLMITVSMIAIKLGFAVPGSSFMVGGLGMYLSQLVTSTCSGLMVEFLSRTLIRFTQGLKERLPANCHPYWKYLDDFSQLTTIFYKGFYTGLAWHLLGDALGEAQRLMEFSETVGESQAQHFFESFMAGTQDFGFEV